MEYPQSPASLYEAVVNGRLTHSGDSRLARHIGNAVLREDARYDPEVSSCPGAIARTGRLGSIRSPRPMDRPGGAEQSRSIPFTDLLTNSGGFARVAHAHKNTPTVSPGGAARPGCLRQCPTQPNARR
jgi:hypothetical protein